MGSSFIKAREKGFSGFSALDAFVDDTLALDGVRDGRVEVHGFVGVGSTKRSCFEN